MSMVLVDRHARLRDAGQWLREQRERRGISARRMATALDVATQMVYSWEGGKNAVSDERAGQIAEVLGMPETKVRRGLGLWVPDSDEPEKPATEGKRWGLLEKAQQLRDMADDLQRQAEQDERRGA